MASFWGCALVWTLGQSISRQPHFLCYKAQWILLGPLSPPSLHLTLFTAVKIAYKILKIAWPAWFSG